MTTEVKRNHFYKKKFIETGVNLMPNFTDLPVGSEDTFVLNMGQNAKGYVLSGEVSSLPSYGSGELVGGLLSLYCSGSDVQSNRTTPDIFAYRMQPHVQLKEGTFSLAHLSGNTAKAEVGQNVALYQSNPVDDLDYLVENFDGDDTTLGTITRMGAGNLVNYSKPYILAADFYQGYQDTYGINLDDSSYEYFLRNVEDVRGEDFYNATVTGQELQDKLLLKGKPAEQIAIRYVEGSNKNRWTVIPRKDWGRNEVPQIMYAVGIGHQVLWTDPSKEQSMSGAWVKFIKYHVEHTAAGNLESLPTATTGNTIFNDMYSTRDFSNYYDGAPDVPVINTVMEISPEKSLSDSQSLRIYHNWGYSSGSAIRMTDGTAKIQNLITLSGNLNPQCARLSLYDLPYQVYGHDIGLSTLNANDDTVCMGNLRTVMPEIQIPMNITKLPPNVLLNVKGATNLFDSVKSFYHQWTSGAVANYSEYENTFLRSIVVTFSNYKPKKEHTSVDKFIAYGLDNYYTGQTTEHIVGGMVFTRFGWTGFDTTILGGTTRDKGANCYAFPLPVTAAKQCTTTDNGNSQTLISGGIGQPQGASANGLENIDTLIWGQPNMTSPNADSALRYAELPMNSWFNTRIFWDPMQPNTSGSIVNKPMAASTAANPSHADHNKRGNIMRVIFDTNLNTTDEPAESPSTQDLPFIDIPFPVSAPASDGAEIYNFGPTSTIDNIPGYPNWFPKHMTIWVQNYSFVSGAADRTSDTSSAFYIGDDMNEEGSSREVELFIDSVKMKGIGPGITNASPDVQSRPLAFKPALHYSPMGMMISGASGAPNKFQRSWVPSQQLINTRDKGKIKLTNSSTTASFVDRPNSGADGAATTISCYNLRNAGVGNIVITGTDLGGVSADTDLVTAVSSAGNTFTLMTAYTGTTGEYDCTFSSLGTLEPAVNRAELIPYNVGENIAIGFNNKADLPLSASSHATDASGYLLWNDFNTLQWSNMASNPLIPTKNNKQNVNVTGGTTSYTSSGGDAEPFPTFGGGLFGGPNYYLSGNASDEAYNNLMHNAYSVVGGGALGDNQINLGSGSNTWFSFDAFRQKGFMYMKIDDTGTENQYSGWAKRENMLVSTKIREVHNSTSTYGKLIEMLDPLAGGLTANQIRVDDATIFNSSQPDEEYIIFKQGTLAGTYSKRSGLKLATDSITSNTITFTEDITLADDGVTPLCTPELANQLWVSPYKYWANMLFDSPPTVAARNYGTVCTVQETPDQSGSPAAISGSTWNEYTYSYNHGAVASGAQSALYKRLWNLSPTIDSDTLIVGVDYGHGEATEDEMAGYLFTGAAMISTYNHYDISQVIGGGKAHSGPNDSFPFLVGYLGGGQGTEGLEFYSDDYTTDETKRPILYWEFKDDPPAISNLSVSPAVNLLGDNVDLYDLTTSDINGLKFTWDEENADDVWYRMLLIDRDPIVNKYHKATMWVPLNETTDDFGSMSASFYTVHNPSLGTSGACAVGTDVRAILEGQGGYAAKTTGNATASVGYIGIPSGTNTGLDNLEEFTLVVHATFATADKGVERVVVSQTNSSSSTTNDFRMTKDTNDKIKVILGADTTMTSNVSVPCDGDQPSCIIVTFNKATTSPIKARLFIDGTEQDNSTGETKVNNSHDFVIGGYDATYDSSAAGSLAPRGSFEEIIIYNKEYKVLESGGEYIYPNLDNVEFDGIDSAVAGTFNYTYNARLVVADYHNFRGASKHEIGMSQPISWRSTTV